MRVEELVKELGLAELTAGNMEKEVNGVYIGDLLSVVMNNCNAGNAWITVQTHMNILNVADLNDVACVIFAGDAKAENSLVEKAEDMGIKLLSSKMEAYELAWKIHEVL